jgi:cytochrome P450 PksS
LITGSIPAAFNASADASLGPAEIHQPAFCTQLFAQHQLRSEGVDLLKDYIDVTGRMMLMTDGAQHARLRRHANPRFSVQAIDDFRPMIHETVGALLDQVQEAGRMDLVKDFSGQLPLRIIMELFAIPKEDWGDFQKWSNILVNYFGAPMGDAKEEARRANEATVLLREYLTGIIRERRAKPGSDMLSLMIHAQEEGRLDEDELVANTILFLPAGYVTTVDQISNGVHALLTHPEQLHRLKEDPSLFKTAVEEVFRFAPTVLFMHRIAMEDIELRGRTIQRGQLVFLGMSAANRDPAIFKDPDRFDITRESNRHVSFGFGPHMCLGTTLARREIEIALSTLFQRMPGLRLDNDQPARIKCNSILFRGFDALPLRW